MPMGNQAYYGGGGLHEQMSVSSFSSFYQGTVPQLREQDSILNDSMTTPPSRKSSRDAGDGFIDAQISPLPEMIDKKRSSVSRSELSFS